MKEIIIPVGTTHEFVGPIDVEIWKNGTLWGVASVDKEGAPMYMTGVAGLEYWTYEPEAVPA